MKYAEVSNGIGLAWLCAIVCSLVLSSCIGDEADREANGATPEEAVPVASEQAARTQQGSPDEQSQYPSGELATPETGSRSGLDTDASARTAALKSGRATVAGQFSPGAGLQAGIDLNSLVPVGVQTRWRDDRHNNLRGFFTGIDERAIVELIFNGVLTEEHRELGFFVRLEGDGQDDESRPTCTGILVSPTVVLTAQHCFQDSRKPADYLFYSQFAGLMEIASIRFFCDGQQRCSNGSNDLAVAVLSVHAPWLTTGLLDDKTPPAGTDGRIAGFGIANDNLSDFGVKRMGAVKLADCANSGSSFLCLSIPVGSASPPTHVSPCLNDSGGPLMVESNSEWKIVGIAKTAPSMASCGAPGVVVYTNVTLKIYRDWLTQVINSNRVSGSRSLAAKAIVTNVSGDLGGFGTSSLRAVPISQDVAASGFDVYVNFEFSKTSGATINRFDLHVAPPLQAKCLNKFPSVSTCSVQANGRVPSPNVRLQSKAGNGAYQLVVARHQ